MVRLSFAAVFAACWFSVAALPAPQGAGGSSCDSSCTAALSAANACVNLPISQAASCICSSSGFVASAQACVDCGGGSIVPAGALSALQEAISGCSALSGVGTASDTSAASSAQSAATTAASSASASGDGIPVTENPTQTISFEAWAPSGFSPSLDYRIAATGGVNTTIAAVETVTVTTLGQTFTATATVAFVLDPTAIAQFQGNDGFDDYTYCKLLNATTGDCIELEYDGTSLTASSEFTLVGATSTWEVMPTPTGATEVVIPTAPSGSLPTQTSRTGTSLIGGSGVNGPSGGIATIATASSG